MSFESPIVASGACGLIRQFAAREISPVQAIQTYLQRILELDPALGAYVHLDIPAAEASAADSMKRWMAGRPLSQIDGLPISLKANIAVAGWPWHAGIAAYRDRTASNDSCLVNALRRKGAIILGLTGMHEGGFGATANNPTFGSTYNPWSFEHSPGGSSGGAAAAVAAGLCAAAIGTDTFGSIRVPAAFCGVIGHRPMPGTLATGGIVPMSTTFDQPGLIARSPMDVSYILDVLTDRPVTLPQETRPRSIAGTSFGLVTAPAQRWPSIRQGFDVIRTGVAAAGCRIAPIELDGIDLTEMMYCAMSVAAAESANEHLLALQTAPQDFSPELHDLLIVALASRPAELEECRKKVAQIGQAFRKIVEGFDAVIMPVTLAPQFAADAPQPESIATFAAIASVAGLAATAFPTGFDPMQMPTSAQVLCPNNRKSLDVAAALTHDLGAPPSYRY